MKHEGVTRILKVVGLIAAAAAVLLTFRFLLNITGGERSDSDVGSVMTTRFEREDAL